MVCLIYLRIKTGWNIPWFEKWHSLCHWDQLTWPESTSRQALVRPCKWSLRWRVGAPPPFDAMGGWSASSGWRRNGGAILWILRYRIYDSVWFNMIQYDSIWFNLQLTKTLRSGQLKMGNGPWWAPECGHRLGNVWEIQRVSFWTPYFLTQTQIGMPFDNSLGMGMQWEWVPDPGSHSMMLGMRKFHGADNYFSAQFVTHFFWN